MNVSGDRSAFHSERCSVHRGNTVGIVYFRVVKKPLKRIVRIISVDQRPVVFSCIVCNASAFHGERALIALNGHGPAAVSYAFIACKVADPADVSRDLTAVHDCAAVIDIYPAAAGKRAGIHDKLSAVDSDGPAFDGPAFHLVHRNAVYLIRE